MSDSTKLGEVDAIGGVSPFADVVVSLFFVAVRLRCWDPNRQEATSAGLERIVIPHVQTRSWADTCTCHGSPRSIPGMCMTTGTA